MPKKIFHYPKYSVIKNNIKIELNLDRFSEQFREAQETLDKAVMESMVPYMPQNTGTFINNTKRNSAAMIGTGVVEAAAKPYGRFLYMGKVMVDPETGSPFARKGVKKVVTDRNLKYNNPQAVSKWFDAAKKKDGASWIKEVKRIAGQG